MGRKNKSERAVVCVFVVYWLAFGFLAGSLATGCPIMAVAALDSLYVGASFLFAYCCKERIRIAPFRYISLFVSLIVLMIAPYQILLGGCFLRISIISLLYIAVAFGYTYLLKSRISQSPWLYLFPFFFLFLTMLVSASVLVE